MGMVRGGGFHLEMFVMGWGGCDWVFAAKISLTFFGVALAGCIHSMVWVWVRVGCVRGLGYSLMLSPLFLPHYHQLRRAHLSHSLFPSSTVPRL